MQYPNSSFITIGERKTTFEGNEILWVIGSIRPRYMQHDEIVEVISKYSPRNYPRQKAIVFDIAIEEKIIDSKFLPSTIWFTICYEPFSDLLKNIFSFTQMFTFLRRHSSTDSFTWSISFPFILHFNTLRWSERYCRF